MESKIENLITQLRRRSLCGSYNVAKASAELLRSYVQVSRWRQTSELITALKEIGHRLVAASPTELAIGNIVRRVLFIVREEEKALKSSTDTMLDERVGGQGGLRRSQSAALLFGEEDELLQEGLSDNSMKALKPAVIGSINELIEELDNLYKNIADQAIEHIHANEIIMTMGRSRTVEKFLRSAARKRSFAVIVAESAPGYQGQELAANLAAAGIDTTLISDKDIFSLMARVNKVIISTHAVMANGGLLALSGTHMLALAAKTHEVPVVVCTGLYKLSPLYPTDKDTVTALNSPSSILPFEEVESLQHVRVDNPAFDYVPPELVDLYITNFGGFNPSYIYRLLSEWYSAEDFFE